MPEGDTILRAARTLARALNGKTVTSVRASVITAPPLDTLVGHVIAGVTARGKNLLIAFDDGRVLHTHMMMLGSWHLYRPGERWQKPAHRARIALTAGTFDEAFVAVCFSAPVLRLLAPGAEARDPSLARLGPDILADGFDPGAALARLRTMPAKPLGEALLVQAAIAGIGNIYKSESLFARRANPFATVSAFADHRLLEVIGEAQRMMRRNVAPGSTMRTTSERPEVFGRYAVYRRSGEPCVVCGGRLAMKRQGAQRRSTYYCARCQQVDAPADGLASAPPHSALPVPSKTARYARSR